MAPTPKQRPGSLWTIHYIKLSLKKKLIFGPEKYGSCSVAQSESRSRVCLLSVLQTKLCLWTFCSHKRARRKSQFQLNDQRQLNLETVVEASIPQLNKQKEAVPGGKAPLWKYETDTTQIQVYNIHHQRYSHSRVLIEKWEASSKETPERLTTMPIGCIFRGIIKYLPQYSKTLRRMSCASLKVEKL